MRPRTAAATAAIQLHAAERALDDPIRLARAARVMRRALARGRITLEESAAEALDAQLSELDGSAAA